MQLQIECNDFTEKYQVCWTCNYLFETQEARVIICSNQGINHGEVCPQCLERGFDWLNAQFDQIMKSKSEPKKTPMTIKRGKVERLAGV